MQITKDESKKSQFRQDIDRAMDDLEQLAGELRVKLHLAELDAKQVWDTKLEPQLFEARVHAKEATAASRAAIASTLEAFRDFAQGL